MNRTLPEEPAKSRSAVRFGPVRITCNFLEAFTFKIPGPGSNRFVGIPKPDLPFQIPNRRIGQAISGIHLFECCLNLLDFTAHMSELRAGLIRVDLFARPHPSSI